MALFLAHQRSPYGQIVVDHHGNEQWAPAMHLSGPTPHGRNADTGNPSDWGPNVYGYTDRDDYHLAIYGA